MPPRLQPPHKGPSHALSQMRMLIIHDMPPTKDLILFIWIFGMSMRALHSFSIFATKRSCKAIVSVSLSMSISAPIHWIFGPICRFSQERDRPRASQRRRTIARLRLRTGLVPLAARNGSSTKIWRRRASSSNMACE